nr:hypothetical protein [Vibrio parahaemolyticus]
MGRCIGRITLWLRYRSIEAHSGNGATPALLIKECESRDAKVSRVFLH